MTTRILIMGLPSTPMKLDPALHKPGFIIGKTLEDCTDHKQTSFKCHRTISDQCI